MKKIAFFILMAANTIALSQVFEIPPAAHPYSDVIEWKGMGAILINMDPSGKFETGKLNSG